LQKKHTRISGYFSLNFFFRFVRISGCIKCTNTMHCHLLEMRARQLSPIYILFTCLRKQKKTKKGKMSSTDFFIFVTSAKRNLIALLFETRFNINKTQIDRCFNSFFMSSFNAMRSSNTGTNQCNTKIFPCTQSSRTI
jgi:hypothetical protein